MPRAVFTRNLHAKLARYVMNTLAITKARLGATKTELLPESVGR